MSAKIKVLRALLARRTVGTRPSDQMKYGTNQVPDIIRKIRNEYGRQSVITKEKLIQINNRTVRVAEYRMPSEARQQIRRLAA